VLGVVAALASLARGRVAESQSGENPEPPFSAAFGMAAALGLAFFGVRASWIAAIGGDPQTPFYASLGLAAALGLVFFGVRASWVAVVLRLAFFYAWACCVVS
jgi:hypothetical protein